MSQGLSLIRALVMLSVTLFAVYVSMNWAKISISHQKVSAVLAGPALQTLTVKKDGKVLSTFSLPTSDLMDASGQRQLNMKYLTHEQLTAVAKHLKEGAIYLNDVARPNAKVSESEKALMITLPEKKLYLLTPPFTPMAIKALMYERQHRSRIFSCEGKKAEADKFCTSVKMINYRGLSAIKEKELVIDGFFDAYQFPRGRWIAQKMSLKIGSQKTQAVTLTYRIVSPFKALNMRLLAQPNAEKGTKGGGRKVSLELMEVETGQGLVSEPLYHYEFKVDVDLNKGINNLVFQFNQSNHQSGKLPKGNAGLLTALVISASTDK